MNIETRQQPAPVLPQSKPHDGQPSNCWSFGVVNDPGRKTIEDFIAARFLKAYGARLSRFMPELVALKLDSKLMAACGLRKAAASPLFLETYLDLPVEQVLAHSAGITAERGKIVEVGNLSVVRAGVARHLIAWLTLHLYGNGMHWALFSAVPALRNNFLQLGIPLITLSPADPGRLDTADRAGWGTYYEQAPQVAAVSVISAFEILRGSTCRM